MAADERREAEPEDVAGRDHARWYARKRFLLALGLALIAAAAAVAILGDLDGPEARLFPDRPDTQPQDQERRIGESATIDGLRATVMEVGVEDPRSLGTTGPGGKGETLVVRVTVENISGQPREVFNAEKSLGWRIQVPDGRVQEQRFYLLPGEQEGLTRPEWDNPELAGGGVVQTRVLFNTDNAKGDFYIIWKPNASDAARGVWKVTISG